MESYLYYADKANGQAKLVAVYPTLETVNNHLFSTDQLEQTRVGDVNRAPKGEAASVAPHRLALLQLEPFAIYPRMLAPLL